MSLPFYNFLGTQSIKNFESIQTPTGWMHGLTTSKGYVVAIYFDRIYTYIRFIIVVIAGECDTDDEFGRECR